MQRMWQCRYIYIEGKVRCKSVNLHNQNVLCIVKNRLTRSSCTDKHLTFDRHSEVITVRCLSEYHRSFQLTISFSNPARRLRATNYQMHGDIKFWQVFRFTATLDIPPQMAVSKQWPYIKASRTFVHKHICTYV